MAAQNYATANGSAAKVTPASGNDVFNYYFCTHPTNIPSSQNFK